MMIHYYSANDPFEVTQDMIESYHRDGVLVIENMISSEDCQSLMQRMHQLVEQFDVDEHRSVFSAVTNEQKDDSYFLESGGKIRYFFEKDAFDEAGELVVDKQLALNKVGHALHDLDPVFNQFSRQQNAPFVRRDVEGLIIITSHNGVPQLIAVFVLCHHEGHQMAHFVRLKDLRGGDLSYSGWVLVLA